MARQGLNCTFSYTDESSVLHTYQVRAGNISYGVQMISDESAARTQRAYYPHKSALQQFTIRVLLKNWDERTDFVNWLSTYAATALDPDSALQWFPWVQVDIPGRDFSQVGVPLQGYQWGAHTGMMYFPVDVLFESATSPGQNGRPPVSGVINQWSAFASDASIQYFYPFGTQLSGNQQGTYAQIAYPGDPTQFTAAASAKTPGLIKPPAGPGHPLTA
jgi:hypothetical protein